MNTMTFRGHWYQIEGIVVASALIFYIGVNLPSSVEYDDSTISTKTDTVTQELTRRGTRTYSASDLTLAQAGNDLPMLPASTDVDRRRIRADDSSPTDGLVPQYDDRRNRVD